MYLLKNTFAELHLLCPCSRLLGGEAVPQETGSSHNLNFPPLMLWGQGLLSLHPLEGGLSVNHSSPPLGGIHPQHVMDTGLVPVETRVSVEMCPVIQRVTQQGFSLF